MSSTGPVPYCLGGDGAVAIWAKVM